MITTEYARFKDLRPPRVETNAFTYHLNGLVAQGFVEKSARGYSLGPSGLRYLHAQAQQTAPGVMVMALVQNSDGDVLLERRTSHPHMNSWALPFRPVLGEDASLEGAADRMIRAVLGVEGANYTHAGDCYVRVVCKGEVLTSSLVHLYSFNTDIIETTEDLVWARPHKLDQYVLYPATAEIIARGFFRDPYFFEEFTAEWPMRGADEPTHQ
ncbi:MAG TPA: hypothetical protein QF549_02890 [Candidatus Saccharimonadaceae bacterium]|nr:hypothetical protein [Candidatus Saccharimonadaceae bacterium]